MKSSLIVLVMLVCVYSKTHRIKHISEESHLTSYIDSSYCCIIDTSDFPIFLVRKTYQINDTLYFELQFNEFVSFNKRLSIITSVKMHIHVDSTIQMTIQGCGREVYMGSTREEVDSSLNLIYPVFSKNLFEIEKNLRLRISKE